MSIISDIFNVPGIKQPTFFIYDNNYIFPSTSPDATNTNNIVFAFNSLLSFAYNKECNVAYEPLEGGSFTSDSIQNMPYTVNIVAAFTPSPLTIADNELNLRLQTNSLINLLKQYEEGLGLLTISMQNKPLVDVCTNMKLTKMSYEFNAQQTSLDVSLKFQEIRNSETEYGDSNVNSVSDPSYSSTKSYGQQIAVTPNQSRVANYLAD